jgi:competence protein ComEA
MPVMTRFQLALFAAAACTQLWAQDAPRKASALLQEACTACHGLNRLETSKNRAEWKDTVDRMVYSGADVKPEEVNPLVGFLVRYYGESVEINKATAQQLQDELDMTPAEAEAVVKARAESGNFKSYADIQKIKGLDPKRIDPIKDRFRYN